MSGLDKFIKKEGTGSKPAKKAIAKKREKVPPPKQPAENSLNDTELEFNDEGESSTEKPPVVPTKSKFNKHVLRCQNRKCNYQRILMKFELSPADSICPKCQSEMLEN